MNKFKKTKKNNIFLLNNVTKIKFNEKINIHKKEGSHGKKKKTIRLTIIKTTWTLYFFNLITKLSTLLTSKKKILIKKNKPNEERVLWINLASSCKDKIGADLKLLYHCGEKIKSSEKLDCSQLGR